MQFLANENIPQATITHLRQLGYDVVSIGQETPGISDQAVLERARHEQRIILTFDRDYGELVYRLRLPVPAGIVYFRTLPTTPDQPAQLLIDLLNNPEIPLAGMFTVINSLHVRQRPLPQPPDDLAAENGLLSE